MEKIKIKNLHKDIERYLEHDCYCPGEIYSFDGFFYLVFNPDEECIKLGETDCAIYCVSRDQVLCFYKDDSKQKIEDSLRYDATENNLKITKEIIKNNICGGSFYFDCFKPEEKNKQLEKVLTMCDAFMID